MAKTADCIAWLEYFINTIGDHQPDKKVIHLLSCFSKSDIYKKMLQENSQFNQPTVSLSHFYNLWEQHFSHAMILKENRFTKCTECTKFKNLKEETGSNIHRDAIDKELRKHLELVWQERRVYYLHRYKARKYPEKYMASIDDGMDQHTTKIPRVRRLSKAMSALTTVNTHLVGAIIHSGQAVHGKEIYGSFDYYQWPHDSNLTMTVLLDVLAKWAEQYKLPPVLYLQLDNCVRENKNQFLFGLLAVLVETKIFEKIRLNFLPVGHTHEDIDAFFGVFSKHLAKSDVYTVEELLQALKSCMINPTPKPFLLPHMYDVRSWVKDNAVPIHDHTIPKCFKFELNNENKAAMFYRNWSHQQWHGPTIILKDIPTGKPLLVSPSLEKMDIPSLTRDIPKYAENMPEEAANFWKTWLDKSDDLCVTPEDYEWPLEKLKEAARTKQLPPPSVQLPTGLQELIDREMEPTREIYTGPYRNPRQRENPIEVDDDYLDNLKQGCFVAVYLENYVKTPVIGKVLEVGENDFKLHYWKGSYFGKWCPQHLPRKRDVPWLDTLPKTCVLCCAFSLSEDKLQPSTRNFLKDRYAALSRQNP